ncbi:MAG: LysR substrate-binding domain-containing protein, partial [Acidimicrobiales bacterium]
ANGAPELLRVVATATVAEFVVPPLLAAFGARTSSVTTTVGVSLAGEAAALLQERLADVCLGPRLTGERAKGLEPVPMMRYGLVVVASPKHRLAGATAVPWHALLREDWLVDPSGTDRSSEVGVLLGRLHVREQRVRV